ncbi:hypothetical protein PIROE2DRAFT_12748 [Piromyces sp. E2]|nr:hypothetical protein PIROE2DRAFT_12748 [Piromyces sp. E2]|eukprot:OUM61288.1 hypothetical protein PIROE2DRAFT_12748 [Piromyces sp. E2]
MVVYSQYDSCGVTNEYYGSGCQNKYGKCKTNDKPKNIKYGLKNGNTKFGYGKCNNKNNDCDSPTYVSDRYILKIHCKTDSQYLSGYNYCKTNDGAKYDDILFYIEKANVRVKEKYGKSIYELY